MRTGCHQNEDVLGNFENSTVLDIMTTLSTKGVLVSAHYWYGRFSASFYRSAKSARSVPLARFSEALGAWGLCVFAVHRTAFNEAK